MNNSLLTNVQESIAAMWATTEAAGDSGPIPSGQYECKVIAWRHHVSKSQTPGLQVVFEVSDGEYRGRRLWLDCWFTPLAMPQTKRDLQKLGVKDIAVTYRPLPLGLVASVKVALRTNDNGEQFNRIKDFSILRFEPPAPDPFAPAELPAETPEPASEAGEPPATDGSVSFDFGCNAQSGGES